LNQFAIKPNDNPTDLNSAYGLLVNYRTPSNARPRNHAGRNFNQTTSGDQGGPASEDAAMTLTQRGTAVAKPTVTASAAPASATSASTVLVDTGTTLVQYALVMVRAVADQRHQSKLETFGLAIHNLRIL
jgi:hypothetical protein